MFLTKKETFVKNKFLTDNSLHIYFEVWFQQLIFIYWEGFSKKLPTDNNHYLSTEFRNNIKKVSLIMECQWHSFRHD